jgi:hypothetical protein
MQARWENCEHDADVGVRGFGTGLRAGLARKVPRTEPLVCVKG